jgi:hypothetical protein
MDLGTITDLLRADQYRYVEEALDDLQLVWDNCKTYNPPHTVPSIPSSGSTKLLKVLNACTRRW